MGCCLDRDAADGIHAFTIRDVLWRDLRTGEGAWNDGTPTCLEAGELNRVRFGYVEAKPGEGPGRNPVVWLECLGVYESDD